MSAPPRERPRLLLFFAPADHPHRDAVCATLAWLAREEGQLFECYFESHHSGEHFGGGHPAFRDPADLRGGTVTGAHHVEALYLLLQRFQCEAVCLGQSLFASTLADAAVSVRSVAPAVADLYREVFEASPVDWPATLLIVGDGHRPQGISLSAYAFPEIAGRRLLAVADGDDAALQALSPRMELEAVWVGQSRLEDLRKSGFEARALPAPAESEPLSTHTRWMAQRWADSRRGLLLADPEVVGRWAPTAIREGWAAVFAIPQVDALRGPGSSITDGVDVVFGRQQDDQDFVDLSRLGLAFQLVDPGRPPFPVLKELAVTRSAPPTSDHDPTDATLRAWAAEGRVLVSLLFWTGMVRELENLYALVDLLGLTGLAAGLVLTTESFVYMPGAPLDLVDVPREAGGLYPRVETLLASAGAGAAIESAMPVERFGSTLRASVEALRARLGPGHPLPTGWWGTMDAPLEARRPPRAGWFDSSPRLRVRYRAHPVAFPSGPPTELPGQGSDLRSMARRLGLRRFFEPLRPFEAFAPGQPVRGVLEAVRSAGFTYAFTKSAFGPTPRVVDGIDGLVVMNYTTGRWDGWTPFETINTIGDLKSSERHLLRSRRPGWLVGTLDSCLWAFSGEVWRKGAELNQICRWAAAGGSSGRLINVPPRVVARYAAILEAEDRVERITAN